MMVQQIDDQIALQRRWAHKLYHMADNANFEKTAKIMEDLQHSLDDARALLSDMDDAVDDDAESGKGITVKAFV